MAVASLPAPTGAAALEAPVAATARPGAGLDGLTVATIERGDRLAAMRAGTLGSVHSWELVTAVDGPGTRLTVFLSGCPLQCLYCHNPDTLRMRDGTPVEADAVLDRVRRYIPIFRQTGGGLTLSGGEVLMQPAFAARILAEAKQLGVHTALDTSGYLGRNATERMLDNTDLVLLDVKSGDPETYRTVTGRPLEPTLAFGERLARHGLNGRGPEVWVRFVLVPGLTDDPANVDLVAEHVARWNAIRPGTVTRVEVLPFHQMGREKWHALQRPYALEDTPAPEPALVDRVVAQFRAHGLTSY